MREDVFNAKYEEYTEEIAELVYEETCICDTPLCNTLYHPINFFCHGGDFELGSLLEGDTQLEETHSCYTNRNQCFIMKYKGGELMQVF